MKILFGVAEAIRRLHSIGIEHHAITSSNILFNSEMDPVICDFGLDSLRQSPGRSDLYAYGCLVYSVLTGVRLEPSDPLPDLGLQVPAQFLELILSCWGDVDETTPTFEGIVLGFFGKLITVGLQEPDLLKFRDFHCP
jgi:serine/threonine protein kinase